MKFKKIEENEARKIIKMIQGDEEMRNLAVTILNIKENRRFSLITILATLITGLIISGCLIVFIGLIGNRWYLIPLIIGWLLQLFWSFIMMVEIADDRKGYDTTAQWITNN